MKDYCDYCGEEIPDYEARYVFPDGYLICPECASEWIDARYKAMGVIDLVE